jgi:hypothetical protein
MLWFKANNVATRQVLYNEGGGSNGFSMYVEGGKVYCLAWWKWRSLECPNASIVAGQWSHCFVLTRVHPMDIISKDI